MSITDELRKYVTNNSLHCICDYLAIADRIDEEHQKAIRELNNLSDASVLLPVDADGVPIHLGDTMCGTCPSGKYVCGEVSAIGDNKFWLSNVQFSLRPDYMHHYHKPTVEDVLREFGDWYAHTKGGCDEDGIIAEYAAKLRLAGDGKEQ